MRKEIFRIALGVWNDGTEMTLKKTSHRQSFLHGALILTMGMIIVKVVGALFKIPFTNIFGTAGFGLFNNAYALYSPIYSIATAGLPIALAKMVAENYSLQRYNDVRQIKRISIPIFAGVGILGTAVMMLGASFYCNTFLKNPYVVLPMIVLAPTILFSCVGSIYRGYYEGLRNMYPTAVSEIIESIVKLAAGLGVSIGLSVVCRNQYEAGGTIFGVAMENADVAAMTTLSYAAAGAIFAITLGSFLSTAYLILRYRMKGDSITPELYRSSPKPHSRKAIAKKLIYISLPIALGSIAMSVAGLIDSNIIQFQISNIIRDFPQFLENAYGSMLTKLELIPENLPNALWGCYGAALSVYMLVPSIMQAFATSALPNVTESWVGGNRGSIKNSIETVIRISAILAFPAGLGLCVLSVPVSRAIYGVGGSTPIVADSLVILALASIGSALSSSMSAVLQAVGRVDLPVKILAGGLAVKIIINYILCGIPEINAVGASWGTLICYSFVTVAEFVLLRKISGVPIGIKQTFIKPFMAGLLCAAFALGTYKGMKLLFAPESRLEITVSLFIAISVAAVIYFIALFLFKIINKSDVLMLPKGEKLAAMLKKLRVFE